MMGFLFAIGAIVGFGAYGLPLKYYHVTDMNPIILQFYFSFAIFASSWLLLIKYNFIFTPLGLIGAAIWTNTSIMSFLAIKYAGLAIAQGTWSGSVIIVSFLFGALYFHEPLNNIPMVILSLILIFLGILFISSSDTQLHLNLPPSLQFFYRFNWLIIPEDDHHHDDESTPLISYKRVTSNQLNASQPLIPNYNISSVRLKKDDVKITHHFLIGVLLSVILGAGAGCLFVPMKFLPPEFSGDAQIVYLISFGIGVLSFATLYLIIYILYIHFFGSHDWRDDFQVKNIPAALVGGVIWAVANFCSTFAFIYLGMAIGGPLCQASIIVAGFCGIVLLKEISRIAAILQFFAGSFVLLAGCAVLSFFH